MSLRIQVPPRSDTPEDEEGSHYQSARCVAKPPSQPDRAIVCPGRETTDRETGHAESWADCRAHYDREREFENVLRALKGASATRELTHKPGAAKRFQRIARGDAQRSADVARSRDIDQKCADK